MLGKLPKTLKVNGVDYDIRSDYRDILTVITAYADKELSDSEKVYVCLKRIFCDLAKLPPDDYEEAYKAATAFIECNMKDDKPSPKVVNWEKDEQLIFPAINKVAGVEVRALDYLHWWTFLGYFQNIEREDTWGYILMLRQKKAKGKKLEKHEKEFYNANRSLCDVEFREDKGTPEDALARIFADLLENGGGE